MLVSARTAPAKLRISGRISEEKGKEGRSTGVVLFPPPLNLNFLVLI